MSNAEEFIGVMFWLIVTELIHTLSLGLLELDYDLIAWRSQSSLTPPVIPW